MFFTWSDHLKSNFSNGFFNGFQWFLNGFLNVFFMFGPFKKPSSSLPRSVPEKILLKKISSTAAPTTSCAPRSCNILSIENNLSCNSRRTANQTRRGEGKYGKSLAAPRLGTLQWESISPWVKTKPHCDENFSKREKPRGRKKGTQWAHSPRSGEKIYAIDQRLKGTMARVGYKRTGGRAILLMINVSFTISFVSFHISFRTTSHSILSFRSSIVRTYNLHSLRLHPKMYFLRKKGYFLVCSAPFQRRFFSR